jgi:hypothetical protein
MRAEDLVRATFEDGDGCVYFTATVPTAEIVGDARHKACLEHAQ